MKNIKNIIFDLDGTLIDSSEGVVEAVNYSLEKTGEPIRKPEEIKPFIGYPLSRMYPHFTDKPFEELYKHFQTKGKETIVQSTVPLPDVENVLKQLKNSGYTLSIASTKIRPHIEGILNKLNWNDYFDCFTGGNEVTYVKPAPDIFHLTMKKLSISPDETIVVGDTINDVLAAMAVPMKVIAVKSPYGEESDIKNNSPDYFIDNITELTGVLNHGKN